MDRDDEDKELSAELDRHYTEFIRELHSLPVEERDDLINTVSMIVYATMEYADDNGFLYEMLTEWPNKKIVMLESTITAQLALSNGGFFNEE